MPVPFIVGEVINPEAWGIRIRITSLEPLEAVVIKCESEYPGNRDWMERFFPIGRTLRFIRGASDATWRIDTAHAGQEMPWFILGIYEGRKAFEHYR